MSLPASSSFLQHLLFVLHLLITIFTNLSLLPQQQAVSFCTNTPSEDLRYQSPPLRWLSSPNITSTADSD
jgi:hypothetical protein